MSDSDHDWLDGLELGPPEFDPRRDHPFSPAEEARREKLREEWRAEANVLVNVMASGDGGDGYYRRGWRAEKRTGPWLQLVNVPVTEGLRNIIVVVGWRPFFSLTLDMARKAK